MNRPITFLGYKITIGAVDDIERSVLSKIRQRAAALYADERSDAVAACWIEAVLEHLYSEGQKQDAILSRNLNMEVESDSKIKKT